MKLLRSLCIATLLTSISSVAIAQIIFGPSQGQDNSDPVKVKIRDLNTLNTGFLDQQRRTANDLLRVSIGRQLSGDARDLSVIQTAINRGHLDKQDKKTLQAFGAAMGDVFVDAHKQLNWKVYEDELGASHAVCLDGTEHCIFPMTILSRRIEAGLKPDVSAIYERVLSTFRPHFPKIPYSRQK